MGCAKVALDSTADSETGTQILKILRRCVAAWFRAGCARLPKASTGR
jgi:hypothetical protein